jgi:hypothetical protein
VITSASDTTSSTGTTSGIVLPSTCAHVNTRHTVSVPRGYDYVTTRPGKYRTIA